ncbi:MAG: nicotinamide n-methyltransferase [Pycnora praestabilis]|nr:MAG: nicotinamide n-methyltransferase [Pycnora praestabilis]
MNPEIAECEDEDIGYASLFHVPAEYYLPKKNPTYAEYTLGSGKLLQLRLVGHNPLWGHLLWNAGKILSKFLEERVDGLVRGKDVLELGAGAGLPSLVSVSQGANQVVVTDYPDVDLIENLKINISHNAIPSYNGDIHAMGYLWGASPEAITSPLQDTRAGFDLLILADLLFNHSEHRKLISTVQQTLKKGPDSRALVFFTPYRPWLLEKDLAFFDLAKEAGFVVQKVLETTMDKVMFDDDPGDELLRRTVFGYELKW